MTAPKPPPDPRDDENEEQDEEHDNNVENEKDSDKDEDRADEDGEDKNGDEGDEDGEGGDGEKGENEDEDGEDEDREDENGEDEDDDENPFNEEEFHAFLENPIDDADMAGSREVSSILPAIMDTFWATYSQGHQSSDTRTGRTRTSRVGVGDAAQEDQEEAPAKKRKEHDEKPDCPE